MKNFLIILLGISFLQFIGYLSRLIGQTSSEVLKWIFGGILFCSLLALAIRGFKAIYYDAWKMQIKKRHAFISVLLLRALGVVFPIILCFIISRSSWPNDYNYLYAFVPQSFLAYGYYSLLFYIIAKTSNPLYKDAGNSAVKLDRTNKSSDIAIQRLIWFGIIVMILVDFPIVDVLQNNPSVSNIQLSDVLLYVLWTYSLLIFCISIYMFFFRRNSKQNQTYSPIMNILLIYSFVFSGHLVGGLIPAMIKMDVNYMLPWAVVALLILLTMFPRKKKLAQWENQREQII